MRGGFYGRIAVTVLLAALVILWAGCTPAGGEAALFDYATAGFEATVRGTFTRLAEDGYAGDPGRVGDSMTGIPQAVAATVSVGAPRADGERDMRVTFTEPAVLAGVTVSITRPAEGASSHTVTVTVTVAPPGAEGAPLLEGTHADYGALLRFAEVLLPTGDIADVSPESDGARTVMRRGNGPTVQFFFTEASRLPARVISEGANERIDLWVNEIP